MKVLTQILKESKTNKNFIGIRTYGSEEEFWCGFVLDYNIKQTGLLNIYGVHHNSNSVYSVVNNANQFVGDEQTIQIDISNWQSGTNAIIFQFEDEIHVENFIKI